MFFPSKPQHAEQGRGSHFSDPSTCHWLPRATSASLQWQWNATIPETRTALTTVPASLLEVTWCCWKLKVVCHSNSLKFFHLAVLKGLQLSGCVASPFPPFSKLTCPKSYVRTQTHSLSLLKKSKIIPSPLLFILLGNAAPRATFNNSSQQPIKSTGDLWRFRSRSFQCSKQP